jgi:DNA polymerase-1
MDVERLTDRLNAPIQGTGADGLKLALALLWERRGECPSAVPALVCHDEVVVECREDQAEEVARFVKEVMIAGMDEILNTGLDAAHPDRVPVDVDILESWGDG